MAKTLLLADDSVTIQKVVNISFASEDVTLVTVDNGDDAVVRAKETRPDVILADVVMPGKSGYEVCEEIKADPDLRHIPVLLLSGTFEAFDEERAARAGAAGHVAKPFEAQTLVDQVNELLASAPPAETPAPAPLAAPEAVTIAVAADPPKAEGFDFFEEDLAELDSSESAFAFGDDDFSPGEPIPSLEAPAADLDAAPPEPGDTARDDDPMAFPDRTVAILPDDAAASLPGDVPPTALVEDPMGVELRDPGDEMLSASASELEDSFLTGDAAASSDEAFDFSFERESTAPESIPVESVMEIGGSDFEAEGSPAGVVLDEAAAAEFDIAPAEHDLPPAAAALPDAVAPPDSTRLMEAEESLGESVALAELDDPGESLAPAELMPTDEPMELDSPIVPPLADLEPEVGAPPLPDDSAARAEAVLAEITPSLRDAVHDTLEKIAWESFGEATEKIVHEVVDRVEQIAWEVIPQLTETLVKAEIRRMKGEADD